MSKDSKAHLDMMCEEERIKYMNLRDKRPEVGDWLENASGCIEWVMTEWMYADFQGIPHTRTTLWKSSIGNGRWLIIDMFELMETFYDNRIDHVTWRLKEYGEF